MPNEWKDGNTGITTVPPPDQLNVLKHIHEGLGHVGGDRVVQWLKASGLDIPGAREKVINFRKSCPECARAGGFKKTETHPHHIITCTPTHSFQCRCGRAFFMQINIG